MDNLILTTGSAVNGLRAIVIENRFLRIVVLPEAGAKIWQITYKPLDAELLWNRPGVPPVRHDLHACYDDVWSGGWDELFPNDEAATLDGVSLPDHGELWTGEWSAEPFQREDAVGVHLRFTTPITKFLVERIMVLRPESTTFELQYRFTNQGSAAMPFLWKLHPAFAVSARHRIDFPPLTVVREPQFAGTLNDAPLQFPWPHARLSRTAQDARVQDARVMDLRQVPNSSSGELHFFYGTDMAAGWCAMTNRANGLASALRFVPEIFSTCWLFASYGGWDNLNVAVLEPATGYPFQTQPMIDAKRARWLAPNETLETTVLFAAQEGLKSVGGVEESGVILPGDET